MRRDSVTLPASGACTGDADRSLSSLANEVVSYNDTGTATDQRSHPPSNAAAPQAAQTPRREDSASRDRIVRVKAVAIGSSSGRSSIWAQPAGGFDQKDIFAIVIDSAEELRPSG